MDGFNYLTDGQDRKVINLNIYESYLRGTNSIAVYSNSLLSKRGLIDLKENLPSRSFLSSRGTSAASLYVTNATISQLMYLQSGGCMAIYRLQFIIIIWLNGNSGCRGSALCD